MYVLLRLPHIRQCRSKFLKSPHHYANTRAVCLLRTSATAVKTEPTRSNHSLLTFEHAQLPGLRPDLTHLVLVRNFKTSHRLYDKEPLKPSSKVEVTVQELKKNQVEKEKEISKVVAPVVKKSLKQRIVDEIVHYYHGFRLLGIDIKIASALGFRVLRGKSLTRREYRLMMRTVGDIFRLVPFSVFILVPFMELLLPVFIKFFPGMLPSTFQNAKEQEDKIKQNLKVKLEMAKFLQGTLDGMEVQHYERDSEKAKEFHTWFTKVRTSGEEVSNEDIMKFSKLFEDEITLDSLSRSQLIALCRVLEVQTLGPNNFLRFQLRMKLRSLAADDKMIQKEGVNSMTLSEVQQACRARGMRAYGMSEERLRNQLSQWLDLSLNEKVPPSLLLLSRALMLPETIPTGDKLKATISALPEAIVKQTQASIQEKEGKVDNKTKIEVLKEEEKKIAEERLENREEKKKAMELKKKDLDLLVDKAPVISAQSTPALEEAAQQISVAKMARQEEEALQSKDFEIIDHAIDAVSKEKKLIVERGEIAGLKAEMADYEEDVTDLRRVVGAQTRPEVQESKGARRLFKTVNRMIGRLDGVMVELEKRERQIKRDLELEETPKKKEELLKIDDIMTAIKEMRVIKDIPDQKKLDQITKVLNKMDYDQDGSLKIEDVLKVVEIMCKENVKLSDKQVDELIELLDKEEILSVEEKIGKALQESGEAKPAAAETNSDSKPASGGGSGSGGGPPTGTKMDTKGPMVPPINSIEKNKNSSKML